jgi:ketosteroid isomerase-like protein
MNSNALEIVRAYHSGWSSGDFDTAAALLSETLSVEVPINDYPTKESFADALARFGSQVRQVQILSEMTAGKEVMLLYDMDVAGLGKMRVVEHFTVEAGRIVRLRQIHDTAALRAYSRLTP